MTNTARVLTDIYRSGTTTRRELVTDGDLSSASITNIVGDLIGRGLVMEVGDRPSAGGRPHKVLQINPTAGYVVGAAVGELVVLVEIFDLNLHVLASSSIAVTSPGLDPHVAAEHVLRGLHSVVADAEVDLNAVVGLGVSVPGAVEPGDAGTVHAQTIGWDAVPFGAMLAQGTPLPVIVDNGAKTMGRAEHWLGAAQDVDHAVVVLLGTGVGTSILVDGEVYHGRSGSAGEWGHTTVVVDGKSCRCGSRGCLEAYVGARALVERYDRLRRRPHGEPVAPVATRLAALAADDSRAATQVFAETANILGAAFGDLINLFAPQRIVLGGWAGQLMGERLLPAVREVASRHALALLFAQVSIVPAELGPDAVAVGAATLPISRFLNQGGRA